MVKYSPENKIKIFIHFTILVYKTSLFIQIGLRNLKTLKVLVGICMAINLIISMDWEGISLEHKNLSAISQFKQKWNAPIVHYKNAAYYTNKRLENMDINKTMKSVISQDDEIGLHLHTPRHFVQAAGVMPRMAPCFSKYGDYNAGDMNGQEVMLVAYNKDEVKAMIQYSLEKLKSNGFDAIHSFRAGGWMSDERVWEALVETGIPIESSATNYNLLNGSSWEGDNLQRYISLIWGELNVLSRPYYLQNFCGSLFEIPNNLGAIDYWKEQTIDDHLAAITDHYNANEDMYLVINSHQETAQENFHKLDNFLSRLTDDYGDEINFTTNKDIYFNELKKNS